MGTPSSALSIFACTPIAESCIPKPKPSPSSNPHRRYEYLLPYGVVCPGGDASEGGVVRTRQRLKALLRAFRGTKDFRHFTPRP